MRAGLLTLLGPSFHLPLELKSRPQAFQCHAGVLQLLLGLGYPRDLAERGKLSVCLCVTCLVCLSLQESLTYQKLSLRSLSSRASPEEALRLALEAHILGKPRQGHRTSLTFGHLVVEICRDINGLDNAWSTVFLGLF